jgi:uncharacterized protein YjbJ (UPF0337 family)
MRFDPRAGQNDGLKLLDRMGHMSQWAQTCSFDSSSIFHWQEKLKSRGAIAMRPGTRDEITNTFHDVKGKAPEAMRPLATNLDLQPEGHIEATPGKIQTGADKTAKMHDEFAPDLGKE